MLGLGLPSTMRAKATSERLTILRKNTANSRQCRGSRRARHLFNWKASFGLRLITTRLVTNFTAPKNKPAGLTTHFKRGAISASERTHLLIGNTASPRSGPKNKTTNVLGRPGNHFTPLNPARDSFSFGRPEI